MKRRVTGSDGEKIVILDRGNVELAVPRDWSVKPDPKGFMRLEDATEECLLEVSYMRLPPLKPETPPVEDRLGWVLKDVAGAEGAVVTLITCGEQRMAWADYPYESDDPKRGERRPARGRWLIGANGLFQVLMTFYYWVDDAAWAVPAWERIVATVQLGNGVALASPEEHWSLKQPS